jgi:hypothetical protein
VVNIVYLKDERCLAELVSVHAHFSVVRVLDEQLNTYELEVLNDDYEYFREEDDFDAERDGGN